MLFKDANMFAKERRHFRRKKQNATEDKGAVRWREINCDGRRSYDGVGTMCWLSC